MSAPTPAESLISPSFPGHPRSLGPPLACPPTLSPSFRRQPPLDRRAKATPKLGPVTDPYVLLPSLPPPSPPPRAPYVYYTLCALRPPVDRAFLSFLPSLPARVRVRVLLSVAATLIHVHVTSWRVCETLRLCEWLCIGSHQGCLRDQYGGQTHRHPPREGQLDLLNSLLRPPPLTSFPWISLSFSLSPFQSVWRLSSNENQFSILRGIGDFSSDFN